MSAVPEPWRERVESFRRRAEARTLWAWRRGLALRSRDRTDEAEQRSCLVLAAHPDDETFACGATILRKTAAGKPVKVLIATDGRHANPASRALSPEQLGAIRRAEAAEACAILGVEGDDLVQLAHPDVRTADRLDDVRGHVEKLIDQFRPDEILVNSALDYHPDHRAMNRLVHELLADGRIHGDVWEYPIWYLFDGPWPTGDRTLAERPTVDDDNRGSERAGASPWRRRWHYVSDPVTSIVRLRPAAVTCGPHLDGKRAAIAAYRSQVTNLTGEDSWTYLHDNFVSLFVQPKELVFPLR